MSETGDNQKKPNSNFRKLQKERIEQDDSRQKLSADEAEYLNKLESIADKLKAWRKRAKPLATDMA